MKKFFLSMMLLALPLLASAYDCQVDGIYYNLNTSRKTATVTYQKYENDIYISDYSGSVIIPEKFTYNGVEYSVTTIGAGAFYGCSSLTSLTIPKSVTLIGTRALSSFTAGSNAFYGCSSLSSIHITDLEAWCKISFSNYSPNPLNYAHHLYLNGEEIKDLIIPNSVTSIGDYAFAGCTGLTSVTIPNSVTSIGNSAFSDCSGLTSVHITDLEAWCRISIHSNPLFYAHHLYLNGEEIKDLIIPNSVTTIGGYAFSGCSGLSSVTIPNSVASIGGGAFSGCSGLSSVTIPNSVASIGTGAFSGCSGLSSVTIPNSVASIGAGAFSGCSGLISADIPNSVTKIESETFRNCSGLISVNIGNSVTNIGAYAFGGCTGLASISIPNSVTIIDYDAFYECRALTSVTFGKSVMSVGDWAFTGCNGLTSVHITDIEKWCKISFSNTSSNPLSYAHHLYLNGEEINNLSIPNSITSIGNYAFLECSSLTSVTIPNSVTSIGESAFSNCWNLKTLTLPEDLTVIKKSTFQYCSSLTEVVIPSKVAYIYAEAFANCGLQSVTSLAVNPPFAYDNTFSNYNIPLYVPDEAVNSYQEKNPWSKFSELKTLSGNPIDNKCATPTISYADKRLTFSCETEGVEYHYTITDSDIKSDVSSSIDLSATYEISVYATKSGYTNSDVATATLVWTDAIFTVTTPETPTSAKEVKESIPVLISANGGVITVKSEQEGQPVAVYTADGKALGSANVKDGQATVATNMQRGEIVIVKVGGRSVKVKMSDF